MAPKAPAKPAKPAAKKRGTTARAKKPVKTQEEPSINLPGLDGSMIPLDTLLKYGTFVEVYLQTLDCAEAARQAGFVGTSPASQKAIGGNLLRVPHIATMIEQQYKAIIAKTGATPERVWQEIAAVAFLDPAVFYDEDGNVKPMDEIPEQARRAITGMKVKTGTIGEDGEFTERELKHASKDAALAKLMALHRMTDNDKYVVVGGEEFLAAMEEGRSRAANRGK